MNRLVYTEEYLEKYEVLLDSITCYEHEVIIRGNIWPSSVEIVSVRGIIYNNFHILHFFKTRYRSAYGWLIESNNNTKCKMIKLLLVFYFFFY